MEKRLDDLKGKKPKRILKGGNNYGKYINSSYINSKANRINIA